MIRLLIGFVVLIGASIALGVGGLVLLPVLVLLPGLLAIGAGIFAIALALGIVVFMLRVLGALLVGVGGILVVGFGLACVIATGAIAVVFGVMIAHLLIPLLLIAGLIWLVRRASQVPPSVPASHG